ncbi:MAG TPA: DUF1616 domain-containing protein [Dehalococcoidia bacterium]|nr:DUF1616 domain-containing protein [Dehalococcoidia bacterium]
MRVKAWGDLIVINLLVLVLIIVIILAPSNGVRIIIGIPFILFLPGYAMVAALFPSKQGLDGL